MLRNQGNNEQQYQQRKFDVDSREEDLKSQKGTTDSSQVDSGFLSGANLSSCEISGELNQSKSTSSGMRVDSGLDVGISEGLNQLTIGKAELSNIQHEPTIELAPVTVTNKGTTQSQETHLEPLWKIYYAQDNEGDTQLHNAIIHGHLEAALNLICMAPHPCCLDVLNDDGQSPLHLAVLARQPRVVRRLILAGANPSLRNGRGNTPLHLACIISDLACAKALTDTLSTIERGYLISGKYIPALPQNLEQRNYTGETCLHIAAAAGHVEIVRLLLRLGADLEAQEGLSGRTPLHIAVERGRRSLITFMLEECRPCLDAPTYASLTPYQLATCVDMQIAKELVRAGATAEPFPEYEESDTSSDEDDPPTEAYHRSMPHSLRQKCLRLHV